MHTVKLEIEIQDKIEGRKEREEQEKMKEENFESDKKIDEQQYLETEMFIDSTVDMK